MRDRMAARNGRELDERRFPKDAVTDNSQNPEVRLPWLFIPALLAFVAHLSTFIFICTRIASDPGSTSSLLHRWKQLLAFQLPCVGVGFLYSSACFAWDLLAEGGWMPWSAIWLSYATTVVALDMYIGAKVIMVLDALEAAGEV